MQWERDRFGYAWYAMVGDDEFAVARDPHDRLHWLAQWFSAAECMASTAYDTADQAKAALEAMACDNSPH